MSLILSQLQGKIMHSQRRGSDQLHYVSYVGKLCKANQERLLPIKSLVAQQ
jgi:hypothetical protein